MDKTLVPTSDRTETGSILKTRRFILHKQINVVHSPSNTKHIHLLCGGIHSFSMVQKWRIQVPLIFCGSLRPLSGHGLPRSRGFVFTLIFRHTIFCRTPLDDGSARRRDLYLATQTLYKTNIHAPGGVRTPDLSKPLAPDLRLRPRDHWNWKS
jgi:hypothetical protein